MRVALIVGLCACSAPAKEPAAPTPAPEKQRDLAVAEPVPKEPTKPPEEIDPSDPRRWIVMGAERGPRREEVIVRRYTPAEPRELMVAESDLWSPCVRDYVQAQREDARRALTAAFSRYVVTCDAEKRVVIAPPHEVRGKPFVAYAGTFGKDLAVQFAVCAGAASSIDQIVVFYDGKRWTSRQPAALRAGNCTIASVDDQRAVRRMLRDVIDARDALIAFEGANVADVAVTDEMKRDLRLMLDALDALAN